MTIIKPLECGCTPVDSDPTNPNEGTLPNPFTVQHCPLHRYAKKLHDALEEIMDLIDEQDEDCGIGATTWHEARELLHRSAGHLKCCECYEWCTEKNPADDYGKDAAFSAVCTERFNLVHMTGYKPEHFDLEGGAVLCTNCVNSARKA
jgi:hypothetical protein